jgi:hypothetical protein
MFAEACKILFSYSLGVKEEVEMVMSCIHEWGKDVFDLVCHVKVGIVCYISDVIMYFY